MKQEETGPTALPASFQNMHREPVDVVHEARADSIW